MVKARIQEDLQAAVKRQDPLVVLVLRLLSAAIHNVEIAKGLQEAGLDDTQVTDVIASEAKRRRESIEAYERGGRTDLVQREQAELAVLHHYLPQQLDERELREVVAHAIAETGAESLKDLGKVMATLKPRVSGRAEGSAVVALVREQLSAPEERTKHSGG